MRVAVQVSLVTPTGLNVCEMPLCASNSVLAPDAAKADLVCFEAQPMSRVADAATSRSELSFLQ